MQNTIPKLLLTETALNIVKEYQHKSKHHNFQYDLQYNKTWKMYYTWYPSLV